MSAVSALSPRLAGNLTTRVLRAPAEQTAEYTQPQPESRPQQEPRELEWPQVAEMLTSGQMEEASASDESRPSLVDPGGNPRNIVTSTYAYSGGTGGGAGVGRSLSVI